MNINQNGAMRRDTRKTLKRVVSVIAPIYFFALLFSAIFISAASDVYAFGRPSARATLTVTADDDTGDLSKMLYENKIIRDPIVFRAYARLGGYDERIKSFSGELELSSDMSYRAIIGEINRS